MALSSIQAIRDQRYGVPGHGARADSMEQFLRHMTSVDFNDARFADDLSIFNEFDKHITNNPDKEEFVVVHHQHGVGKTFRFLTHDRPPIQMPHFAIARFNHTGRDQASVSSF